MDVLHSLKGYYSSSRERLQIHSNLLNGPAQRRRSKAKKENLQPSHNGEMINGKRKVKSIARILPVFGDFGRLRGFDFYTLSKKPYRRPINNQAEPFFSFYLFG